MKKILLVILLFSSEFSYSKDIAYIKNKILSLAANTDTAALLLAIAEAESNFNSYAIGPTKDYGLFQFTASGLAAAKRECPEYKKIRLDDLLGNVVLSTNIAICFLKKLNRIHNNNLIEVLIAYNAGSNRARLWALHRKWLPTVTQRYVLKVMHIYHNNKMSKLT